MEKTSRFNHPSMRRVLYKDDETKEKGIIRIT